MRRLQLAELAQLEGRLQCAQGAAVHLLAFKDASVAKVTELEVGQRSQAAVSVQMHVYDCPAHGRTL